MQRVSIAVLLTGVFSLSVHGASLHYPKSFDATYEVTITGQPKTTQHTQSDGQGHMRIDTSSPGGGKVITFTDYPNMINTSVLEAQHMYIKTPLKEGPQCFDKESAKSAKAKELGAKTINGHPCHGYETKNQTGDGTNEIWIGDDIDYMVRQETKTSKVTSTVDLTKWSSGPKLLTLEIPAGYKDFSSSIPKR